MDVLSDIITVMRTGQARSARVEWATPWAQEFTAVPGAAGFQVILRGSCWLTRPGTEPIALSPGDVVFRPHGSGHTLGDSPLTKADGPPCDPDSVARFANRTVINPATIVLCGGYELDPDRVHPLLTDLPDLIHLPAHLGRHPSLRATVDLLAAELTDPRLGTDAIVPALLDTLLLHILRAWLSEPEPSPSPAPEADPAPEPASEATSEADPAPRPVPEAAPKPASEAAPAPAPAPKPKPKPKPEAASGPAPAPPAGGPGTGWAAALNNPPIAAALRAMHQAPGNPWTVATLAAEAGMSRTPFARRFTELTGRPPLTYLTWWRMTTAARLLKSSDAPLGAVAAQVGYGSEFAFATAFKRRFGVPPGRYRRSPSGASTG